MLPVDILHVVGTYLPVEIVIAVSGVCSAWYGPIRRSAAVHVSGTAEFVHLHARIGETGARLADTNPPVRRLYLGAPGRRVGPSGVNRWDQSNQTLQSVVALSFWNLASVSELGVNCRLMSKQWFDPLLLALGETHTPELRTLRLILYGGVQITRHTDLYYERLPSVEVEFVRLLGAVLRGRGPRGPEVVHMRLVGFNELEAVEVLLDTVWAGPPRLDVYLCTSSTEEEDDYHNSILSRRVVRGLIGRTRPPTCSDLTVTLDRYDIGFVPAIARVPTLERLGVAFTCKPEALHDSPYVKFPSPTGLSVLSVLRLQMTGVGVTSIDFRNLCEWVYGLPRLVEFRCYARRNPLCDRAFAAVAAAPGDGGGRALRRWYVAVTAHPHLSADTPPRTIDRLRDRFPELTECRLEVAEAAAVAFLDASVKETDTDVNCQEERRRLIRSMRPDA